MTLTTFPDRPALGWWFAQSSQPAPARATPALQGVGLGERYQFCREALRFVDRLNALSMTADKDGAEAVWDQPAGAPTRRPAFEGLRP